MSTYEASEPAAGVRDDDLGLSPILRAALDAFQDQGYHGTAVRDIAQRAGLSMPALYYHHGSKDGILMALLDLAMDDVLARARASVEKARGCPPRQLANLTTAVVLHMTRRRQLARLHSEHRFLTEAHRTRYLRKRAELNALLVEVLRSGIADGSFREHDARVVGRALLGMLQAIADWHRPEGPDTPDDLAQQYVVLALLLVGHGPTLADRSP